MTQRRGPTEKEVFGYAQTLSNWGRWGPEDQLGTMNLITPEKRRRAAALVNEGVTVSCARPIVPALGADVGTPPLHYMTGSGEAYADRQWAKPGQLQGCGDFIGMVFHGFSITHVDALCHIFWNGQMYNGRSSALVNTRQGATVESIEVLQDGVVSRGVLLDVARLRGVDWMEPGQGILPQELEATEAAQGVRVEEGDVLFIRTGHYRRRREAEPLPIADGWPGLDAACLPWIRERGVAVLGGDTVSDVVPSGYPNLVQPIHQIGIPHMGLWLVDNCNLEELAAACAQRRRWEYLLAVAPLRFRYATGSPVNPIAVF